MQYPPQDGLHVVHVLPETSASLRLRAGDVLRVRAADGAADGADAGAGDDAGAEASDGSGDEAGAQVSDGSGADEAFVVVTAFEAEGRPAGAERTGLRLEVTRSGRGPAHGRGAPTGDASREASGPTEGAQGAPTEGDGLDVGQEGPAGKLPASLNKARWELLVMTGVICGLHLSLPSVITPLGQWWIGWPLLEAPLGLWAFLTLRREANWTSPAGWRAVSALLLVMASAVTFNAATLLGLLVNNSNPTSARLLLAGVMVITMNVLVFGLIYWWWDSGGAIARRDQTNPRRDLLFPQQVDPEAAKADAWRPQPSDYMYTSYTNAFTFSPTDTMPLTRRAKSTFTFQSSVALATITITLALVLGRLG